MNIPSRLLILVGTVTNTAERVAQAIQMNCADLIGQIDVRLMDGLDIRIFQDIFIIRRRLYLREGFFDCFQARFVQVRAHDGARIRKLREDTDMVGAPLAAPDDTDVDQC